MLAMPLLLTTAIEQVLDARHDVQSGTSRSRFCLRSFRTLLDVADLALIQEIFEVATSIIRELRLQDSSFRIITNGGEVRASKHLHFHLISGSALV
jgi:hypothetical protein